MPADRLESLSSPPLPGAGCFVCRLRKKRCNGEQGQSGKCAECYKLNILCPGGFGRPFPDSIRGESQRRKYRSLLKLWTARRENLRSDHPFRIDELFSTSSSIAERDPTLSPHDDVLTSSPSPQSHASSSHVDPFPSTQTVVQVPSQHPAFLPSSAPIYYDGTAPQAAWASLSQNYVGQWWPPLFAADGAMYPVELNVSSLQPPAFSSSSPTSPGHEGRTNVPGEPFT